MEQTSPLPAWITRGKTIRQLIKELERFEDLDLEVRLSIDDGETSYPISILGKEGGCCVLSYSGPVPIGSNGSQAA